MSKTEEMPEIVTIFWDNVEWHMKNKGLSMHKVFGSNQGFYATRPSCTLKKVQEIAGLLNIDDYAILFEKAEDLEWLN